ncbi:DNA polymerase [Geobacter sp. SVR]|uniref:DNA polymerase n=1 Tax=Geobacter sp. SVR TaxID=2495594 RepID=UPI00143EFF53|nr:DNA polymerase [Geobacter sp. SVR]BCS54092.1 hypothetical protein GSVR_24000 [Geobacter sp. SVR]GCF87575.1 hypothetical protein GSbR_41750 [Geobacter sp. SVR]
MAKFFPAVKGAKCAIILDRVIKDSDMRLISILHQHIEKGGHEYQDFDRITLTAEDYIMGSKSKPKTADLKAGVEQAKEWVATKGYNAVIVMGADAFERVMGYKGITRFYGKALWSDILQCKVIPTVHPAQLLYGDPLVEKSFQQSMATLKYEMHTKQLHVEEAKVNYNIIDNIQKFRKFIEYFKSEKVMAFAYDLETEGLRFNLDRILTIQFSHKARSSYLIPTDFYGKWTDQEWNEIRSGLYDLFADDTKTLIGHNIKFDNRFIEHHWNIPVRKHNVFDTMIAKFLCDETTPSGLKELACQYTDMGDYEADLDAFKKQYCKENKLKVGDFSYALIPFDILAKYALADADCTMRLYNIFSQKLIEEQQTETMKMVMRFQYLLSRMEITGSPVDTDYTEKYLAEVDEQLATMRVDLSSFSFVKQAEQAINDRNIQKLLAAGKPTKSYKWVEFNVNSVDQKRVLFFDIIGMPIVFATGVKNKLTTMTALRMDNLIRKIAKEQGQNLGRPLFKNGKREFVPEETKAHYLRLKGAVDKRAIKEWESTTKDPQIVEFMGMLKRFSELSKIRNTYIFSILDKQVEGWIHPSFNVIGARSGRLSCKDPNYQNIPAHSEESKKIKRITKAPEGWVLVGSDLSAAEMRWVTIASGDPKLIEMFNSGLDSHGIIAKEIFGLDCHPNDVKDKHPDERQIAKMCQFLSVYGGQADALSAGAGISVEMAQGILDTYFETYAGVRDFLDKTQAFVDLNGYSQSLLGRRNRHLNVPYLVKRRETVGELTQDESMVYEKELRVAKNATIQSVSSDGLLIAACNLQDEIEEYDHPIKIINVIHDAIYCLIKEEFLQEGKDIILRHLTTLPLDLIDPLSGKKVIPHIRMEASAEWGYDWSSFSEDFGIATSADNYDDNEDEEEAA